MRLHAASGGMSGLDGNQEEIRMKPVTDHEGDAPPEELPPVFPDPPGLEQIIARLRNGEPFKDGLEALEVLAAIMFSSEEEADEFEAWVRHERRKHLA
jgi:hypothetical protein